MFGSYDVAAFACPPVVGEKADLGEGMKIPVVTRLRQGFGAAGQRGYEEDGADLQEAHPSNLPVAESADPVVVVGWERTFA